MLQEGVSLGSITGEEGSKKGYTRRKLPELIADSELGWLIQVGLLRRGVDGQGLTDSFRLTPFGREIIAEYQAMGLDFPKATLWQRLTNFLNRWVRFPF
jgi:hypothetical protein